MNEYVQSKVGPPGIALAVVGMISIFLNLIFAVLTLLSSMNTIMGLLGGDADSSAWTSFVATTGWQVMLYILSFGSSFFVAFAGMRLRNARSAGVVYLGSILAMIPCCFGYCCCIGLPVGIWAIVTMQDEQVKAAFAEQF